MSIFYLLTTIAMLVTFVLLKKANEKLNIVTWCILALIMYLGLNIAVCMVFGVMGVTTNLLFLSIVNTVIAAVFIIVMVKTKEVQSYTFKWYDFIAVAIICLITCYISVKQYTPLSDTIANASVDASMHYSAATHFADNMKVLSKIDNKTGYNFKTMQTGAYINTGILMAVARELVPSMHDFKIFKIFEVMMFTVNNLAFYMLISDKLKNKKDFVVATVFILLYSFAYTYTSLLYGFSYLSVSIAFASMIFYLARVYEEGVVSTLVVDKLIVIACIGLIFSYCLFVPCMYAFICIYVFIVDSRKLNEKKYFKILHKNTIALTSVLLLVTILSICYLVIPTFTDSDQNRLTDAIGFVGQTYTQLFVDFVFYIPLAIFFIAKTIKNKKANMETVAFLIILFQTLLELIGVVIGFVSAYYYYKIYFIIYILFVAMAVSVYTDSDNSKDLKAMLIGYLVVFCLIICGTLYRVEPRLQAKSPMMINDYKMQKLAGIYYDTNIEAEANINVSCIVDANRVKMGESLRDIEGINLKNILVGGMNPTHKAWLYVLSGIESGGQKIDDLQVAKVETTVDEFLKDDEKEFFVLFTADKYEDTDDYTVVFENEAGVVLKKTH